MNANLPSKSYVAELYTMLNQYFTETWDRGYCNFEKYTNAF